MRLREEFLKYVEYQRAAEEMKRPEDFEKAKTDRRKEWLRHQIKETKSLQKTVKEMEKHMGVKTCCPNCGCEL